MKPLLPILLLVFFLSGTTFGQDRYYDEIFSKVTVTQDVQYGTNISILPIVLGLSNVPAPEDLFMDVYEPADDTETERPVVIFAHRGDFLPAILNQTPYGTKRDSAVVEICMDMAKRGFVAISMGYRLGWNPFGSDQEIKSGVLQAAYRLSQDMHTVIRYLRKDAAENGNTFNIDPTRIAVGGVDSAGWGAANVAHLKNVSQIQNLVKFVDLSTIPATPFVIESVHGNPQGTDQALLNIPNHTGYTSEVSAVINLEGGVGDISWIEAGDPPVIALQHQDRYDAVGIRDVSLTAGGSIIIPTGAFVDTIVYRSQELGNQKLFLDAGFDDALSVDAQTRTDGLEGLLLYNGLKVDKTEQCDPTPGAEASTYGNNTYPWNWYDETYFSAAWNSIPNQTIPAQIYICGFNASEGNPNDAAASRTFIDTMTTYIVPRLLVAMNLRTSSTQSVLKKELEFRAFPNPTSDRIFFQANNAIREIQLLDLNGRVHYRLTGLNESQQDIPVQGLSSGFYIAKIRFDRGIIAEKIMISR